VRGPDGGFAPAPGWRVAGMVKTLWADAAGVLAADDGTLLTSAGDGACGTPDTLALPHLAACQAGVPAYHPRMIAIRTVLLVALASCGSVQSGAPSDASPSADAAADCPGLFCSGFEESVSPWSPARDPDAPGGALVEIVDQSAITPHGGAHALHVRLPSSGDSAAMFHAFTASPFTGGELYARAWFQVPMSNTVIVKNHVDLFSFGNTAHAGEEITLYLPGEAPDGQVLGWVDPVGSETAMTGMTVVPSSQMVIPTGSWFCLVLHATIAQNGQLEFDLDQLHSGSQTAQTLLGGGIDEIGVGLEFLEQTASAGSPELYVDDVAVGTSPLSCQ